MNKQKYINAEKFVAKYGDWYTEEGTENGFIGTVEDLVEQMPAADVVEVRHGKWIETNTYPKCSVCGLYGVSDMNYCPNCGAKMEAENA